MPLLIQRIARGLRPAAFHPGRPPADQVQPERIVLGVKDGVRPSSRAPVRIFLGTERGQFRAERIFLWSIEKHRDPSRIYEIYLMRDLKGFQRRFWLTGFTNYRFAIPELAGFKGRAIYNDTDQIYLKDPALLFDTPMNGAGFLSINDRDTSVMLIDCARMRDVWNARDVRRLGRKALEARARQARLWGDLDGGWNARDSEYHPERSHLVHFTTLHTQPWRPFPDELVYFDNPTDPLWPDLEAEADRARFMPVNASRPSPAWQQASAALPDTPIRALLGPKAPAGGTEPLAIKDVLERVPDQDVAWVLERLFSLTPHLKVSIREPRRHGNGRTRRSLWFWQQHLMAAGRLHPQTRWELSHRTPGKRETHHHGGPTESGCIVVLTHRKPGHANQARALGRRLGALSGRDVVERAINRSEVGFVTGRLFGRPPLRDLPEDARILVAGGWLPTRVARKLQQRQPHLRLILAGRKAGPAESLGSVVVQCRHFGLPPHPNRLITQLPLNDGEAMAAEAQQRWSSWLNAPRRLAVLLGGSSRSHQMTAEDTRALVEAARQRAQEQNAALLIVGSRRSADLAGTVESTLGPEDLFYRWQADDGENPYRLALESADELIVTGESESMLADAASRERGFLIWPVKERPGGLWQRFSRSVAQRAVQPRFNRRGSIRPQQGQTYACARALERGWVLPPRDMAALHRSLHESGLAAPFGSPLPEGFRARSNELDQTLEHAAQRLGINLANTSSSSCESEHHEHSTSNS